MLFRSGSLLLLVSVSIIADAEVDSIDFFDWILHLVAVDSFVFEFHGSFSFGALL